MVRLSQASLPLAGWCLAPYPPGFDHWHWPRTPSSSLSLFPSVIRCLVKGTVLPCLPESWMCVNKCTEICSRLLEYTITNINVVRYNPSCENICVGTDSRHLWKPLEHFFPSDFPQNYILNYMWPKTKTTNKKTKAWILLLVTVFWSGPIFVRAPFPGTVKISASLPKNHPVLFQDCEKCSLWEFHFASSPGFVNTVICCHVNNIQVYLLYVNGCRNGWLFSHPDFFAFSNHSFSNEVDFLM